MLQPHGDCFELQRMNRGLPGNQGMGIPHRGNERCKNTEVTESKDVQLNANGLGQLGPRAARDAPGKVDMGHVPEESSNPSETAGGNKAKVSGEAALTRGITHSWWSVWVAIKP